MPNLIGKCLAEIRALPKTEATRSGNPGRLIADKIIADVFALAEAERREMRADLSRDEVGLLFGLASSGAEFAVRENSDAYLRLGLSALIIENKEDDPRETVRKLCILNHSASKIGVDLVDIFQPIRANALSEMQTFVDAWLREGVKDIARMAYAEGLTKDGRFTYKSQL